MKLFPMVALALGVVAVCSNAESQTYQSVMLDSTGQLSITLSSGAVVNPPRLPDQVTFSQPMVSEDHRMVAWLANYPNPGDSSVTAGPIAGHLVVYQARHVVRSFATDQIFWSWQFVNRDRDVAFCTGPTHSGASGCELHRIISGRLLARWSTHGPGDPPVWVKGLSF